MKLHFGIIIIAVIISVIACSPRGADKEAGGNAGAPKKAFSGNIQICGAYALSPLAETWSTEYRKLNPGVEITVGKQGTGQGLDGLRSGTCRLAMISRSLTPEELAEGFRQIPVCKDAVVLIVNRSNPFINRILVRGIDPRMLQMIFTRERKMTWGEVVDTVSQEKLKVFTRADRSGAAEVWANFIWKTQADLKGTQVTGDEEMIRRVQENRFGIGYCNLSYAYDRVTGLQQKNIQVVPLDLDYDAVVDRKEQPYVTLEKIHRAIWLGLYPNQLCRSLSFVFSKNVRDTLIWDYLNWSLIHGDSSAKNSGFCILNDVEKRISFDALNTYR